MHRAPRQVDRDRLDAHLAERGRHLGDALRVRPEAAPDEDRRRVEPHRVGALERALAPHRPHDRDPEVGEAPRDPALLAGAHRRRGPAEDRALRRHEEEVRAEHEVRRRRAGRLDGADQDALVPVGLARARRAPRRRAPDRPGRGAARRRGPARRARRRGGGGARPGAGPTRRGARSAPQSRADLVAERRGAGGPALAAVGRRRGEVGHGRHASRASRAGASRGQASSWRARSRKSAATTSQSASGARSDVCPGPCSAGRGTNAVRSPHARAAREVVVVGGDHHDLVRTEAEERGRPCGRPRAAACSSGRSRR